MLPDPAAVDAAGDPMSAAVPLPKLQRLRVDYVDGTPTHLLAQDGVFAVFGFGGAPAHVSDPRYLHVALEPHGPAPLEVWRVPGPVSTHVDGALRTSEDGVLQFGVIELTEPGTGATDIEATAELAYRRLVDATAGRGYPHLLRAWNYLDGITIGEGDAERYRTFCVGRARGLAFDDPTALPAATAIGRLDGARTLQVYWLASTRPGTPLENPRQLSAYRYPRQYGPQPPSFARAMLPPGAHMPLLISGTAAIVGHVSRHADCVTTQVDETLANIDALLAAAHARQPGLSPRMDATTRLKVYVRDAGDLPVVAAHLDARLGPVPRLVLHAAICRRELRVEIDGVHG